MKKTTTAVVLAFAFSGTALAADIVDTAISAGSFNTLLFATRQPTELENYLANYIQLMNDPTTPPLLLTVMATTYEGLQPLPARSDIIFTDDRAPVEQITNSIILNFLLSGETEALE